MATSATDSTVAASAHHRDKDRPAGGTARMSGNKTPRKVQWKDEREQEEQEAEMKARALDEHALDSEAFEALADKLERHRSSSNGNLPRPRPSLLIPPTAPYMNEGHTGQSSTNQSNTPGSSSSPETQPGTASSSPTRSIPGEIIIEATETEGLPGRNMEKLAWNRASDVVRAHTRRFNPKQLRSRGGRGKEEIDEDDVRDVEEAESSRVAGKTGVWSRFKRKVRGKRRSGDVSEDEDVEKEAQRDVSSPQRQQLGVLSTLLTLYDNGPYASGASTPTTRTSMDTSISPSAAISRSSSAEGLGPPVQAHDYFSPQPNHTKEHSHLNQFFGPASAPAPPPSVATKSPSRSPKMPRLKLFDEITRPPPQRNGAGVIGSLIASTGNISGAAAPSASTLAPNIKRPGYHLSRYSLETDLPKAEPKKSLSRPRSMMLDTSSIKSMPVPMITKELVSQSMPSSPQTSGSQTPMDHSPPAAISHAARPLSVFNPESRTQERKEHRRNGSRFSGVLKDLPKWGPLGFTSQPPTPGTIGTMGSESGSEWLDEKTLAYMGITGDDRKREKRKKRKKAEVYITRHVAEIIQRQEFILKFARAMMMFGGPTHRLQAQVQATGKVLDINLSCMYLPDVMLISFDDTGTSTSNVKLIRQGSALDLDKLGEAYRLYWKVIHDSISVKDASVELDTLMRRKPMYSWWQLILIGGFCSSAICSVSFSGSFIDSVISWPLGALLVAIQLLSVKNELYSNIFEITIATLISFLSAALASTGVFCYSAVASASIVLILPGFIVLNGSLELSSRNIVSGAVRLCFAIMYSLFLGFGLAIGAEIYQAITHQRVLGPEDYSCAVSHHPDGGWWQRTPSTYWAFLTVPMYSLFLSLRNHAPWNRRELYLLVAISCCGWVTNHFTGTKFPNQSDISAAVGAFAVGFISNIYGRFFKGNAFIVMITGILFQLPSGLGNGGLLTFASQQTSGSSSSTSYLSGFQTALQLVSVSIGLTVGLGISIFVVHPVPSRRRAGGVFSL
ncbi:DUF1212-domain-containing protein [Gloeophyllum trabeum ATCC 11539]|uniref:DUF1212-domain-containing protein n=1 Tax=Gloeophyllum trabeum (strain ATCC 11539 / FP-39264 / Madison 617) TaxID=670483 RepID=S7RK42_GLOTA|nr:DUF1212-domain-containing protein [Gloeophyllum trabeum ATCC 11539]EPQ52989.1 DUF1212-domain-containing protein [Gloeophyllum trabeum ATCC 11539]